MPTSLAAQQQQQFMLRPSQQQSSMVPSSIGQFFPGSIIPPGFSPQMNLNPTAAMALFAQAAATAFPQIPSGSQLPTTQQQQQLRRPTNAAGGGTNQNSQQTLPPATIIPSAGGGGTQSMLPPPIGISNTVTPVGVRFHH